ncbi:MAG: hypothetical protein A2W52_03865 [Candidatus Taylorbacteria bacterium RIFCSPHIGHO2_02_49_25]|uniref:Homing endonuclease LAGLIDADG domain-containing protein n=2 Tax=Parcubacteria group TaxID=1794811 RepID=A0A1F6YMZ3_9BACT|nr:MAG: hypothetical protein A2225_02380 [Candidatus Nomurabacteria bacterium RIFOXYA2_FULL_42_12]OHA22557.1 MAG: hypothetical protein A2W52_03865 [Candidatus Taylorbacteria bacterium RIFCSPHIGHO2_02_49_25]OHA36752.1 MAG: hypothetical protein A2W65_01990 [Candidatus Taylorbacteria bacterium RIFCSPLOWO2_02_50_13]OHA41128.1 MAG: hypothetical protein A3H73_02710 [Candidatus Taylorbacteria bacterium RIFCSPLOWO2_02_FULL_50_120]OHA47792.1 MAG: hypothetical protein A3G61_03225 [Candidatus Taylorbacter
MNKKGVIVGSTDTDFCNVLLSKPHHAYVLGLWCADGYHRTSSIGLSSVSEKLAQTFLDFFRKYFDFSRLKLRIYLPVIADADFEVNRLSKIFGIKTIRQYRLKKAKVPTLHLYVNSRPMLRSFREARRAVVRATNKEILFAYFARRFDGDGSISEDKRSDCRIVYSNQLEAENDKHILVRLGFVLTKVYHYKDARTYCLYVSRLEATKFLEHISRYSPLQKSVSVPSRDLIYCQR